MEEAKGWEEVTDMEQYLTVAQAADVLGVHRTAVNMAIKAGKLQTVTVMGKRALRRADLAEYKPHNHPKRGVNKESPETKGEN